MTSETLAHFDHSETSHFVYYISDAGNSRTFSDGTSHIHSLTHTHVRTHIFETLGNISHFPLGPRTHARARTHTHTHTHTHKHTQANLRAESHGEVWDVLSWNERLEVCIEGKNIQKLDRYWIQ